MMERIDFSRICREKDFDDWNEYIDLLPNCDHPGMKIRKIWEWAFILYVLDRNGMLTEGKTGLGFAVGEEPLPAIFASRGCIVTASDYWEAGSENAWTDTNQNAAGDLSKLNKYGLCTPDIFEKNVSLKNIDMTRLSGIGREEYDFCWSSCAVEHLGSIETGIYFLLEHLSTLKPGGIAVHTVEFNLSSNIDTITNDRSTVLFRECDIRRLENMLGQIGFEVICNFDRGDQEGDRYVDTSPYFTKNPKYHLHLELFGYECTSYALVIRKPPSGIDDKKYDQILKAQRFRKNADSISADVRQQLKRFLKGIRTAVKSVFKI